MSEKIWITKYLPESSNQIIGREKEISQIREFVSNYSGQKSKSLFLAGPCGSGKTSAVLAIANEYKYEVLEINASDVRNKDQIAAKVGPALLQKSFFYDGKIILIDEVDGLSGTKDRGGATELAKLIQTSKFPIILTANDVSHKKLSPLLKKSLLIPFERLSTKVVVEILEKIVQNESLIVDDKIIKTLAVHSDGDVRAAINDLQLLAQNANGEIGEKQLELLSTRSREETIEQALQVVFKTTDAALASQAFNQVTEDIDTQLLWLDYNMPFEYKKPKDLARAYGAISKADVYKKRIRKNQEWRFLVYMGTLLSAGIATAKDAPYATSLKYKQSSRPLKIWQINMSNAKRKAIALKIAEKTHTSTRVAFSEIPYYQKIFKSNSSQADSLADYLELEKEEVAWLKR